MSEKLLPLYFAKNTSAASDLSLELSSKGLRSLMARSDVGFLKLPALDSLWSSSQVRGGEFRARFKKLVLIGIGGSALGPQTIDDIFGTGQMFVLDNLDPVKIQKLDQVIQSVGIENVGFVITSKSGSTLETVALASIYVEALSQRGLKIGQHCLVITEPTQNPLRKWAEKNECVCLDVPLDVGGRYSVLSPVGMLAAAFLNTEITEWRKGAAAAVQSQELCVQMAAHCLDSFRRDEWITVSFFYSSVLRNLGGWWQQLWAESLAKKLDLKNQRGPRVSTPFCAVGACDQHSLLQQMMEGAPDKWILFYSIDQYETMGPQIQSPLFSELGYIQGHRLGKILNTEARATHAGLLQSGISSTHVVMKDLSEHSIGFYFMHWQMVVAVLGEILNIDAYTQPGVELAKRLAKENLVRP